LPEWIEHSATAPKSELAGVVYTNDCLRLAKSVANRDKHHSLDDPDDLRASIKETHVDGETGRYRVRLEYTDPHLVDPLSYDALQLAEECLAVWTEFLRSKAMV
jgi:hypothetical protein